MSDDHKNSPDKPLGRLLPFKKGKKRKEPPPQFVVKRVGPEELQAKLDEVTGLLREHAKEREEVMRELHLLTYRLNLQATILKYLLKAIGIDFKN